MAALEKAINQKLFGKKVKKVAVVNTPTVKLESSEIERKPTLYLTSKDLPEIKDWSVGDKYEFEVKVKMTGLDIQRQDDSKVWCGHFEIESIDPEYEEEDD